MRRPGAVIGVVGALALLLSGCGEGGTEVGGTPEETSVPAVAGLPGSPSAEPLNTSCEEAVGQLVALDDTAGRDPDVQAVFDTCASVEELAGAVEVHPEALDGTDPEAWVDERCGSGTELAETVLCESPSLG